jgi:hypothetical protein
MIGGRKLSAKNIINQEIYLYEEFKTLNKHFQQRFKLKDKTVILRYVYDVLTEKYNTKHPFFAHFPHNFDVIHREFKRLHISTLARKAEQFLQQRISKCIKNFTPTTFDECKVQYDPPLLRCGEENVSIECSVNLYNKLYKQCLQKNKNAYILALLLRYRTLELETKSFQFTVPKEFYQYVQQTYKFKYEGFASPINNYFDNYYSAFDIDKQFQSLGSFFASQLPSGRYVLNPPFEELAMTKTSKLVLDMINCIDPYSFIVIYPYWPDCKALSLLEDVTIRRLKINKLTYTYRDQQVKNVVDTVIYFVSNEGLVISEQQLNLMEEILSRSL